MKRLLIVGFEPAERASYLRVLRPSFVVDEAFDAAYARILLSKRRYKRALIEVDLPDGDGLQLLSWMRERGLRFPVLLAARLPCSTLPERAHLLGAPFVHAPVSGLNLRLLVQPYRQRSLAGVARDYSLTHALTPRQTEVVEAIARGNRPSRLHTLLGVERSTVKSLTRRVLAKTGAASLDDVLSDLLRTADRASDT